MNTRQAGFTLIELVMVIVILGILAAFALPRFADLGGQARVSTVEGIAGSMRSAAGIVHSMALATAATASVDLEGTAINLTNGYPHVDDINDAAGFAPDGAWTVAAAGTNPMTWRRNDAGTPAQCQISYTAATATAAAIVAATVTDC